MTEKFHVKDKEYKGKIISLIASTTEIVCALGCEENLVGISYECDFPDSIMGIARCSSPRIDEKLPSINIENSIQDLLKNALSIYTVNSILLTEISPDIILTQDMCRVCAVSTEDVKTALNSQLDENVLMYSFSPNSLDEIFNGILEIGNILGKMETARNLVSDMKIRIKTIKQESQRIRKKPKVCAIEWIDPIYSSGNWMPELIEIAGGYSLFSNSGNHSSIIKFQQIVAEDPDVILIFPCGWDITRSLSELDTLTKRPEWQFLKAIRNKKVYILDGNQYFNRPGPRIIDSIEILTEIFHPWKFIYEFEGKGWVRFNPSQLPLT